MNSDEKLALNNCDKEPIHIPGRIQAFGSLLAFDISSGEVRYQSDNFSQQLLDSDEVWLGKNYEEALIDREVVHGIRGALGLPTIRSQREPVGRLDVGSGHAAVSVYQSAGNAVVEFELEKQSEVGAKTPVSMVRSMASAVRKGEGLLPLLESSVQVLRHLTGHDRVMAYRFLENGDGEVIAEAKGNGIDPYLGLRYPAWDIPVQARQIMMRAPFRVIPDIHDEHSALLQHPEAEPLDLTQSHLRGVSPIHVEYLTNMGVRSTMNVSLIVRGQLWGMFAWHHYRPRHLPSDHRSICELFGQLLSMHIQQEEERTHFERRQNVHSIASSFTVAKEGLKATLGRSHTDLMGAMNADGMALVEQVGSTSTFGDTPESELVESLCGSAKGELVSIDSLGSAGLVSNTAGLGTSAGTLLLKLPGDAWLAFFRNEIIHEIRWAGKNEKEISYGPNGPRLSPRGSFAEYRESVAGRCNPWTETDTASASEIVRQIWKIMQLGSAKQSQQLEKQKHYQDLLIAELNHRVRNTLALVRSIARQTQTSSVSVEQYVEALERRIAALSKAHDLIGGSGLQWARISDLIHAELKPYEYDEQNVRIDGSPIALRADIAPIIALLFHEVTSNAVKHGALSSGGGQLAVSWKDENGGVTIDWVETLPETIDEPERRGFGFALIERAVPYECGGKSTIRFAGKQLKISFWLPADSIDRLAERTPSAPAKVVTNDGADLMDFAELKSALVVEDNLVLAMEVERLLRQMGIESVDTVPSKDLAAEALERSEYGCAILDINLGAETSFDIAVRLIEAGTLVVLASGYDSKYELPVALVGVPRIVKPIGRIDIAKALSSLQSDSGA